MKEFETTKVTKTQLYLYNKDSNVCIIKNNKLISIDTDKQYDINLTSIIKHLDDRKILNILLEKTSYIVMLIQERIDRQKSNFIDDTMSSNNNNNLLEGDFANE